MMHYSFSIFWDLVVQNLLRIEWENGILNDLDKEKKYNKERKKDYLGSHQKAVTTVRFYSYESHFLTFYLCPGIVTDFSSFQQMDGQSCQEIRKGGGWTKKKFCCFYNRINCFYNRICCFYNRIKCFYNRISCFYSRKITLKTPRKFPLLQTLLPLFPLVRKCRNCLIFLHTGWWTKMAKNQKILLLLLPFFPSMTPKIPRIFPKFLSLRTLLPLSSLVRESRNCLPKIHRKMMMIHHVKGNKKILFFWDKKNALQKQTENINR